MSSRGVPSRLSYPQKEKLKIKIICEGNEERRYIKRLLSFNVWNSELDIEYIDVSGITNITDFIYSDRQARDKKADFYFVLCDSGMMLTESRHQFKASVYRRINHDFKGIKPARFIVAYANPCTMQIFLSHFEKVKVPYEDYRLNRDYIMKISGVRGYNKRNPSVGKFMNKITPASYKVMKKNLKKIYHNYHIPHATNALMMFNKLERKSTRWVKRLKRKVGV